MSRPTAPHDVDRDVPEFLQELRVAQTGGQIFFAFLFSIAFASGFDALDDAQRQLYMATLLVVASSTIVLVAPVAVRQWNFGRRMRREWLITTHFMAALGLALLGVGLLLAVVLVTQVVGLQAWWLPVALVVVMIVLWIAVPLTIRMSRFRRAVAARDDRVSN